ncbi:hypothetical protein Y032_0494g2448 [Ancylostoma ceylanicum]|uniref:Uncharacterized protein n=1 Tax=Ancylostoma ceylanicum TaxID=53326 RepID=A0A016WVY2_9BILA|nr:hypothetical protein Y032_0494g2448 [Ancylostoma ceylanicum]
MVITSCCFSYKQSKTASEKSRMKPKKMGLILISWFRLWDRIPHFLQRKLQVILSITEDSISGNWYMLPASPIKG